MVRHKGYGYWFGTLVLALALLIPRGHARLQGMEGLAPSLPEDVPGVERPFPQDAQKFTFAIVGDKTGGGQRNWPIFDRAIDEINRLRPDFTLIVGDLIQGYTTSQETMDRQWKEFMEHASRIEVPFFFLPGNHDISNKTMYEYWAGNVGRTYYGFDYKDCHFLLLNTEEGWRTGETQFGSMQMEFIRRDLASHANAKHTFLFMHRPVWYGSGEGLAQWETVESYLAGRPYTVFAGHFHNLAYEWRKAHRYFVLSATGAGLTPNDVLKLGSFHHYTTVTVDGDDVHIAFIQPGSIHPMDIAPREFKDRARQILSYERNFPLAGRRNEGSFTLHLNNSLDQKLALDVRFTIPEESTWTIAPKAMMHEMRPGEQTDLTFQASYTPDDIGLLPSYRYEVSYGGKRLYEGSATLVPVDNADWVPAREWLVLGAFDLGIEQPPTANANLEADLPRFIEPLPPEEDWDPEASYPAGEQRLLWKEADANSEGKLDLNRLYEGDFKIAYGMCAIESPNERWVYARIQRDDLAKVFVNGKEVYRGFPRGDATRNPDYFALPLQPGWNQIAIKSADYKGGWSYTFAVADPDHVLRLARQRPK